MDHATSLDGTTIAFEHIGHGPPIVIVGGAFSTASAGAPLADALASRGFTGVTIDRRARGGSGDTAPYAPPREVEDLAAVIEAVGGDAAVLGHSSGAILALFAAAEGVPITHLFMSEPPFHFGHDEPAPDLAVRMQQLIDAGHPGDAVILFQREGVGLPDDLIAQIQRSPMFDSLAALAQSAVYDATLTAALSTPPPTLTSVATPVTLLRGEPTMPILVAAVERLAELIPQSELVVVPESHDHGVDPSGTAREVTRRLRPR